VILYAQCYSLNLFRNNCPGESCLKRPASFHDFTYQFIKHSAHYFCPHALLFFGNKAWAVYVNIEKACVSQEGCVFSGGDQSRFRGFPFPQRPAIQGNDPRGRVIENWAGREEPGWASLREQVLLRALCSQRFTCSQGFNFMRPYTSIAVWPACELGRVLFYWVEANMEHLFFFFSRGSVLCLWRHCRGHGQVGMEKEDSIRFSELML